jgi:hypothetical protein
MRSVAGLTNLTMPSGSRKKIMSLERSNSRFKRSSLDTGEASCSFDPTLFSPIATLSVGFPSHGRDRAALAARRATFPEVKRITCAAWRRPPALIWQISVQELSRLYGARTVSSLEPASCSRRWSVTVSGSLIVGDGWCDGFGLVGGMGCRSWEPLGCWSGRLRAAVIAAAAARVCLMAW